ncbi:universal stress protein [Oerskovia jenensis]|uniref:Nucleotide-binding universal stress UspA family protein n=1 Tax=Oerskovia jenensis TaxID=162169 RepID=A0ABS2LCB1_9CELL|nr:universal stress protein [Oerskovia jenensis]MBM7478060.1 nucleotide-binding universal stress UspA family protein [Oerskovia jenensis]
MGENRGLDPQPVVLGVAPGQPDHIVHDAARFATQFGAELICAHVNAGRFAVAEDSAGTVTSAPIDPDYHDEREDEFDPALAARLAAVLDPSGVRWSTRLLVGDTADALGHLAETVDAAMIVVGTHERGFGGGVQEFFNRSIAVHLAHRQNRPVVVVPARAPGVESPLPWVTR